MNLYRMLQRRAEEERPIRVGLIGAGKFGSMFLAQARLTKGMHVMGIADLDPDRARKAMARTGWDEEQFTAADFCQALETGRTFLTDDSSALIEADGMEVVIDATGHPRSGIRHARLCCQHGRHVIMVNVEADVVAGPLLARQAESAGLVYSLAYGDQPALICENVDWARACGLHVVAAGKGTKYLDEYRDSTPETVWEFYGLTAEQARAGGMNSQMFNSFLDGTKSAIEMAAVANANGLAAAPNGLQFPPCGIDDLPKVLCPQQLGGCLHTSGQVEVISCLHRDGRPVEQDLRWGVFVVFEATSDYAARCLNEYGLVTDPTGRISAMYKPYHLVGLELGISVASAALRNEPTGVAMGFSGDVAAVAKRDLKVGDMLDGEGGYMVRGQLMPAAESLAVAALPIGLAQAVKVINPVTAGDRLSWSDVEMDSDDEAVQVRRQMEAEFSQ
ncbi:MAG: flagellar biosynthesis protein FlgA [Phycisphaerae bacterium]|nr:flagellar biosynthesis protein FlgA [Phycisphaerae bacterium]